MNTEAVEKDHSSATILEGIMTDFHYELKRLNSNAFDINQSLRKIHEHTEPMPDCVPILNGYDSELTPTYIERLESILSLIRMRNYELEFSVRHLKQIV